MVRKSCGAILNGQFMLIGSQSNPKQVFNVNLLSKWNAEIKYKF